MALLETTLPMFSASTSSKQTYNNKQRELCLFIGKVNLERIAGQWLLTLRMRCCLHSCFAFASALLPSSFAASSTFTLPLRSSFTA